MPRPKEDKTTVNYRVKPNTPDRLNKIAACLGYTYGQGGAIGKLLDDIAEGRLKVFSVEDLEKIKKILDS
jgi:hypothetical protein